MHLPTMHYCTNSKWQSHCMYPQCTFYAECTCTEWFVSELHLSSRRGLLKMNGKAVSDREVHELMVVDFICKRTLFMFIYLTNWTLHGWQFYVLSYELLSCGTCHSHMESTKSSLIMINVLDLEFAHGNGWNEECWMASVMQCWHMPYCYSAVHYTDKDRC